MTKKRSKPVQPSVETVVSSMLEGSTEPGAFSKRDLYLLELTQLQAKHAELELQARELVLAAFVRDAQEKIDKAKVELVDLQKQRDARISAVGDLHREISRVYGVDLRTVAYDSETGIIQPK